MTPSFVALTKTIPTLSTLLINAVVIISWLNRAQLAVPQAGSLEAGSLEAGSLEAGSLEAGSLGEADQNEKTHPET